MGAVGTGGLHALLVCVVLVGAAWLRGRALRTGFAVVRVLAVGDLVWVHRGQTPAAPAEVVDHAPLARLRKLLAGQDLAGNLYFDTEYPGHHILVVEGRRKQAYTAAMFAHGIHDPRRLYMTYAMMWVRDRGLPESAMPYGVRYLNDATDVLAPAGNRALFLALRPLGAYADLQLQGVSLVITSAVPRNPLLDDPRFIRVGSDPGLNLRLLRLAHPLPRAYIVDQLLPPVVPGVLPDGPLTSDAGTARVLVDQPGRMRIAVDVPVAHAYVAVTERSMAGWRATVDGARVTPRAQLGRFLAVPVARGRHDVVLSYHPPLLVPGALLSALGVVLLLAVLAGGCRRDSGPVIARVGMTQSPSGGRLPTRRAGASDGVRAEARTDAPRRPS